MSPLLFLLAVRLVPDAANVEYRQPQLAADKTTVAVTFGAGNAIYFAASRDRGRTFSKPVKVAESGALSLGRHRGPRVAITPAAIVVSAIVGEKGGGADGDLVAWRSVDGGNSWSNRVVVNDVTGAAREGLHAMAADGKGRLFAAWLDLRTKGTKVYGARSNDGGATWSKNVLVYESPDGHVCECCHPSVASDAKGDIYVMWRNWLGGARDMYIIRSSDGGQSFLDPEKAGTGTWPLQACPMDGGALAIAPDAKIVSVWRRVNEVFLAPRSGAEMKIEIGKDPAIAYGSDGVYAAWSSAAGIRARIPGKSDPTVLSNAGGFVQLAAIPNGPVLAAWESKGEIIIHTVQ